MATHHASAGEIVNLETWAQDLAVEHSKAIVKTPEMELARLVLGAGEGIEDHHAGGPLVAHCLSGEVELTAMSSRKTFGSNELVHLDAGESFKLKATQRSLVLITFLFT